MVLEKTLESPLDCKEIKTVSQWELMYTRGRFMLMYGKTNTVLSSKKIKKQSVLKAINPEYSLEGLMQKLKLQYFGYLMQRTNSLEKALMLGKIEGRRRRGQQRMRWLHSITGSMNVSLFQEMVKDREAWCAAVYGVTKRRRGLSD